MTSAVEISNQLKMHAKVHEARLRFEAVLSSEQKERFLSNVRNNDPPQMSEVMQFIALIDKSRIHERLRCFGQRFEPFLSVTQKICGAVNDSAGSTPRMAVAVWEGLKIAIVVRTKLAKGFSVFR